MDFSQSAGHLIMLSQKILSSISSLVLSLTSIMLMGIGNSPVALAQEQIKIGVSAPLTGDLAQYGAAVRHGIELAVSEDSSSFKSLDFVFEDNQYKGSKAVSAFQKLTNVDAVKVIYNWGEPTLHAIAPIAETNKVPVVAMSLDPVPAIGKRYIIRSINYSEQYAVKLLGYLRIKGLKKIAIINTEDPFLNSMIAGLKKHLSRDESLEVIASVNPEDQDFKSQIARLKTRTFDVVGVYLFTGQVSQFYRQARALVFKTPTFGTDFFESKTEILQAQGGLDGAFYPNIDVPKSFAADYLQRYGDDAQIAYAYNSYSFAKVSAVLLQNAGYKLTSDEIMKLYENPPKNLGFSFADTKDGGRFYDFPIVIKQIKGNEIETAW
jgi:branched-chain amino acid transport system substrate-binding protein